MRATPRLLAPIAGLLLCTTAWAEEVQIIARQEAWTIYLHESKSSRICFAAAQPRQSEPATAKRDPIFFYISTWPGEAAVSEVSVKAGYLLRKGSNVTVAIGTSSFRLSVKDDRAFVADAADEKRLLETLRKGGTMTVTGVSERGTQTKDTYSLAGLGPALDRVSQGCS